MMNKKVSLISDIVFIGDNDFYAAVVNDFEACKIAYTNRTDGRRPFPEWFESTVSLRVRNYVVPRFRLK